MPDATTRAQHGTSDGHRTSADRPGLDQVEQMPTQTANLGRQGVREGRHAPFPPATRWKLPMLAEALAQSLHVCGGLSQPTSQFMHVVQVANNHDD